MMALSVFVTKFTNSSSLLNLQVVVANNSMKLKWKRTYIWQGDKWKKEWKEGKKQANEVSKNYPLKPMPKYSGNHPIEILKNKYFME